MRILFVEDQPSLARAVLEHLQADHHVCDWFETLEDAETVVLTQNFDLVLLDLQLPDGNGLTLLKTLRAMPVYTPVIIVTARDKISERIAGLNLGADDYIIKPYDLGELSARIETVSRRPLENASQLVQIDEMEFDLARHQVSKGGEQIVLTAREWSIMECLLRRPNAVVSRSRLEEIAYALDTEIESNAIEAHISRLRTKLGKSTIVTHRGLGYSLQC